LKKKVGIIGTNGLPAKYGGFETLANYLVRDLSNYFDLTVYCSKLNKNKQLKEFNGAKLVHLPLSANGMQGVLYDILCILHSFFTMDTLLILGSSGTVVLPLNFLFRKKIVFNFGGLDWQREKWNVLAKKFLKISEAFGVKYADTTVVDNAVFAEYVKNTYKLESKLIEYGGDHVIPSKDTKVLQKHGIDYANYFLSVSRAQEDNYIHILLDAFVKTPEVNLVVISNWQTCTYGINLKSNYSNYPNIKLVDAVYDQNELDAIRSNAEWYIHTHSACGSAPSLIEGMSLGLPIISFDVPANRSTTEGRAIYFKDIEELKKIIQTIDNFNKIELASIMKEIASRRYRWKIISGKYKELF
jgi:glycosyltransferase involved in cell wall biosynthesis